MSRYVRLVRFSFLILIGRFATLECMIVPERHTHAPSDDHGQFCYARAKEAPGLVAVVATLSKGYDLDYIWKQVDRGPAKDAASYYIQASESGGEPPGRWWGPGARALGFEPGQRVEREPYDLLFGERKAPDGTQLGRPPDSGRKAADLYAQLLAAEPHATAERKRELRTEAVKKARQSPLFFDLTIVAVQVDLDLPRLPRRERPPGPPGRRPRRRRVLVRPGRRGRRHDLAGRARRVRLLPARGRATPAPAPTAPGCTAGRPASGTRRTWRWRTGCSTPPGTATCSCTSTPRSPTSPGRHRREVAGPGLARATTSTSARSPRSSPSTWKRPSPPGSAWNGPPATTATASRSRASAAQMMRVFSSRRESITADLRGRAARFEQRYGRAPSQRELAQLAQASNFTHAQRPSTARWISRRRTRAGRTSSRAPSACAWRRSRRRSGTAQSRRAAARTRGADAAVLTELELARAAQKAVALAQQEKSAWTRADLIKYLGRVLPRTGRDPAAAAALLEDLADRALASEFEPVTCLEAPEPAEVPRELAARGRAQRLPAARRHPVRHARAAGHGRTHGRAGRARTARRA